MQQPAKPRPKDSGNTTVASIHLQLLKYNPLIPRLLVGVLALACYLNSIWGHFAFDDSEAIIRNQDVDPATPLSRVFTDDFWGKRISDKTSHKSYRPLTVLTFRWNYWLAGGLEPFGFHLTNVVLHGIVSVLYLEVCHCLISSDWTSGIEAGQRKQRRGITKWTLLAGMLFAVHPIHAESVSNINSLRNNKAVDQTNSPHACRLLV